MKKSRYTFRIWPERIAGQRGHWFEIRDSQRRVVKTAWGIGSRAAARTDAMRAIHDTQHDTAKVAA